MSPRLVGCFLNTLTTQGIGCRASKQKDWEAEPVNKRLLWICTTDPKKKKIAGKNEPLSSILAQNSPKQISFVSLLSMSSAQG